MARTDNGEKIPSATLWDKLLWPFRAYKAHTRRIPKWLKFVEGLAIALVVALILREVAIQASWVPTGSMKPTLLEGDFMLVNRLVYLFRDPVPGDIIVFRQTQYDIFGNEVSTDLIKRCVAVGGEWIKLEDGYVWKDDDADHSDIDEPLDETAYLGPGVYGHTYTYPVYGGDKFEEGVWYEVPEDKLVMLGDNREHSADSRFWGYLDEDDIKGKAFVIYMSFEGHKESNQMMLSLKDIPYYLANIRWDRLMDMIE